MKQSVKFVLGIALIAAGVLWILSMIGILNFNIFFDGWWTMFIILPCLVGLLTDKDRIGPLVGISIGTILLLSCQNIINWDIVWGLCGGVCIIALGLALIFKPSNMDSCVKVDIGKVNQNGKQIRNCNVSMGRQVLSFDNEVFEGANLQASFGAVTMDLRKAIINDDVIVKLDCSFCGVEIYVPDNVIVKVAANSSFGGIKDLHKSNAVDGAPTIFIVGNVAFAGAEIK